MPCGGAGTWVVHPTPSLDHVTEINEHSLEKTPGQNFPGHLFSVYIVLIYQECGDSAWRSHNEITRHRGQIKTIGVGLLRPRSSGKFYTVCVIILYGVFCVMKSKIPVTISMKIHANQAPATSFVYVFVVVNVVNVL